MTTHYIELKAIPQMDMLQSQVVGHCMQVLHKFLPHFEGRIGIAFPTYGLGRTLGGILRIFGSKSDCQQLYQQLLQAGLQDYALMSNVLETPFTTEYRCYSRVHRKGKSAIRRTEKFLKSIHKWHEGIREDMIQHQQSKPYFPHVHLKSKSTNQRFVLAIKVNLAQHPRVAQFSHYGLSDIATVPHF